MFEKLSRLKVRFATEKGMVSVEDLWDMPLTSSTNTFSLDDVARYLDEEIDDKSTKSFVIKKPVADEVLLLKFEAVKHIIAVKLDEAKAARKEADNKREKAKLLEILGDKKDEELKGLSTKELEKMIKKL